MATLNFRRFTKYETMTAIRSPHLLQLLDPYKDYFVSRGVTLPVQDCSISTIPYAVIAQVLMTSDAAMPPDLVEALYYIHEMATPQGMDAMMEALEGAPLAIPADEQANRIGSGDPDLACGPAAA